LKFSQGHHRRRGGVLLAAAGLALLLAAMLAPGAQARVESFEPLPASPVPLTSVAADPTSGLLYAQENGGEAFFVYNPRTRIWTELAPSPLDSGNNGGAAYLAGKIYTTYTSNNQMGVYDILTNTWSEFPNPLGEGTGNIVAANGKLYLTTARSFVQYDPASGITTPLAEAPVFDPTECYEEEGFQDWGGLQFNGTQILGHQGDGCRGFAVYDIAGNSWAELPPTPALPSIEEEEKFEEGTLAELEGEGPVLGSALYPTTNTYLTYGPYSGRHLYRYDIETGVWSSSVIDFGEPESEIDDGGMAYIDIPGLTGVYMVEGEDGEAFGRYVEQNQTALSPSVSASVAGNSTGGEITYSIRVANNGPERASGIVLSDSLPSGATLVSASTSQGTCSAASCELGVLRSGQSADVTVKAKVGFGTFTNTAKVTSAAANTASNSASVTSTLTQPAKVTPPPPAPAACVIPRKLSGRGVKGVKKALRAAHCKPGKVTHRNSGKVKRGHVIRTGGKPGKARPSGSKVNLTVSKGPKQHKGNRKH
jgi:uncharacterized repeat protein (TIGR01451 family)